jgi:hypothetical protein
VIFRRAARKGLTMSSLVGHRPPLVKYMSFYPDHTRDEKTFRQNPRTSSLCKPSLSGLDNSILASQTAFSSRTSSVWCFTLLPARGAPASTWLVLRESWGYRTCSQVTMPLNVLDQTSRVRWERFCRTTQGTEESHGVRITGGGINHLPHPS